MKQISNKNLNMKKKSEQVAILGLNG